MEEFPLPAVRWEPAFGHPLAKRSRGNAAVGDCFLHQHPWGVRTDRQTFFHEFRDALRHALDQASEIQPDDNGRMGWRRHTLKPVDEPRSATNFSQRGARSGARRPSV